VPDAYLVGWTVVGEAAPQGGRRYLYEFFSPVSETMVWNWVDHPADILRTRDQAEAAVLRCVGTAKVQNIRVEQVVCMPVR
jgi:hypothetical protein